MTESYLYATVEKGHTKMLKSFHDRFLDPLMFGDYPSSMRSRVGSRLPNFTQPESALLKGSLDFVGINHYTTYYARNNHTNTLGTLLHDSIADSGAVTLRKFKAEHSYQEIILITLSELYFSLKFAVSLLPLSQVVLCVLVSFSIQWY